MTGMFDHIFVLIVVVVNQGFVTVRYRHYLRAFSAGEAGARMRSHNATMIRLWILAAGAICLWQYEGRSFRDLGLGWSMSGRFFLGLGMVFAIMLVLFWDRRRTRGNREKQVKERREAQVRFPFFPHSGGPNPSRCNVLYAVPPGSFVTLSIIVIISEATAGSRTSLF